MIGIADVLACGWAGYGIARISVFLCFDVIGPGRRMHEGIELRGLLIGCARSPFRIVFVQLEQRIGLVFDRAIEMLVGHIGNLHVTLVPPSESGYRRGEGQGHDATRRGEDFGFDRKVHPQGRSS